MRNNTRGLLFHLFTVIIVFALAWILNLSETLRQLVYGNIFFRILLSLVPILLYYNFGKGMSKKSARQLDFLAGNIIVLLAILFFILSFLGLGREVFSLPLGSSMWKFPLELFLMPQIYVLKINHLPLNIITLFLSTLVPGILYGISIKKGRAERKRRLKTIRHQQELRRRNRRK